VADFVRAGGDGDDDGAVGVGGAAGIGVVGEAVLGPKFAVDAIEDGGELLGGIGIEHGAAGGVGHGFEGMFAGGVAATFVFHGANDDGVNEGVGADRGFAGGIEVGAAGGFAGVSDEDDDATAVVATLRKGAGAEEHGVVDRSAGAIGDFSHGLLQGGNIVGEGSALANGFIEGKNGQAVTGTQDLANEMRSGFLFEADFFVGAQAGIDHQGDVEGLRGFGLEDIDFLLNTFFEDLKRFAGKIRRGTIVFVENADEDVDEIDGDLDAAALLGGILRIVGSRGRRGLDDFAGLARGRGAGSGFIIGAGFGFLGPGGTVGLVLGERRRGEDQDESGQDEGEAGAAGCHVHWILRCGFRMWRGRGGGRQFAVGPDSAVFEVLFFPNGDSALQGVNGEAAGIKSGGAVRSADGDEDAGFAHFEAAETMDDGYAVNFVFFVELGGDLAHFGEGHGFVGFVVKIKSGAIVGLIADEAVEGDDGAVFGRADVVDECGDIDRVAHELADVVVEGRGHGGVRQPPLTGGRKATSSPAWRGVSQAANSWLREATREGRNFASSGWRAA
jgi:hypothetical protein